MLRARFATDDKLVAGQTGTKRALLCAVVVAASGVGLAGCSAGASDAVTTLHGATGVSVTSAGHRAVAAVNDQHLLVGDTVATGADSTLLDTGGRLTTIAAHSSLTIAARSRYLLNAGTAVVNRHSGENATVVAGSVTVDDLGRTSVRIDRAFAVRVAVYGGGGVDVFAGSRELSVPTLHQLQVPGASLPTTASPLALFDDAMDQAADPTLVADDQALNARAAGLDTPAGAVVGSVLIAEVPRILPAAQVTASDSALPLSERVLAIAIARCASESSGVAFGQVEALRSGGGAWAVVAALTGAPLARVESAISMLADGSAAGGSTTEAGAGGVAGLASANSTGGGPDATTSAGAGNPAGTVTDGGAGQHGGDTTTTPTASGGTHSNGGVTPTTQSPTPTASVSPSPTPTPTSSAGLVATLLNVVGSLLSPTPSSSSSSPSLLGGLL